MRLKDVIYKELDLLSDKLLVETDKKKIKELNKQYKKLYKEYMAVIDKDWTELKKDDVEGVYDDLKPHRKKIISDEEYAQLMDKWSKKVGEKLLYPLEQKYQNRRNILLESIKDIMTPEEIKEELRKFDYDWEHRKEEAEDRIRREQEHIQYVNMINSMTPEELKRFRSLRDENPERDKLYKSVSEVKTKDEE